MMNKNNIRIKLVRADLPGFNEDHIYLTMVGKNGPVLGQIEVFDEEFKDWFSLGVVAPEIKRIVS
jgi:hypothetical protein